MLSVLWEIIIPLFIACGIGVFLGWMLFRWRRTRVTEVEWETINRRANEQDRRVKTLTSERNELDGTNSVLQTRLRTVVLDLTTVSGERDELRIKCNDLQTEMIDLRARHDALGADLALEQQARAAVETALAEANSSLAEARDNADGLVIDLTSERGHVIDLRDELEAERTKVGALQSELGAATSKLGGMAGLSIELDDARTRIGNLEASVVGVEQQAQSAVAERDQARSTVVSLQAELDQAGRRDSELRAQVSAQRAAAADLEARIGDQRAQADALRSIIDEREDRIADLEEQLAARTRRAGAVPGPGTAASPPPDQPSVQALADQAPRGTTPSWATGTTSLGTFGDDQIDDLKVINGVGPKMESILNSFGITSWEQVAALTPIEVERVSHAIQTFPGRIERDGWVRQASDLVARFPDRSKRPDRSTFLNDSTDTDPWT